VAAFLIGKLNRARYNQRAHRVDRQPADKPGVQIVPERGGSAGQEGENKEPNQGNDIWAFHVTVLAQMERIL